MKIRLLSAGVLALSLVASPSQADVDVGIYFGGAAIHGNGFSLYLGGPYDYAPYDYYYSRPRYHNPRHYHAPPRYYAPPRHHHRSGHKFDNRHSYRRHDSRDYRHSYRRHDGRVYRRTHEGSAWRDANRRFFRGDERRH